MKEKNTKEKVIDYSPMFAKIVTCLYIVIAILTINTILTIASLGGTSTKDDNNNENETIAYDPSKLNEMTTDQVMNTIKSSDMQVIYIGSASCGYCAKFIPVMEEAQNNFGYKTTYIDLAKVTESDQSKLTNLDSEIAKNFGSTPMLILAKDGKVVAVNVGYIEYSAFEKLLTDSGMTKK